MARDLGPKCRICRREGMKLFLKSERCLTEKCAIERRSYPPGEHGRGRIKQSEYLLQLREKQKARRYYGLLEKQFRTYYSKAAKGSVNIPSYQVKPDDIVMLRPGSSAEQVVRDATDLTASVTPWLQADHDGLTGKVLKWPTREEIDTPVQESLIVELYSK